MIKHSVHVCEDDVAVLQAKLDELVQEGSRIVTVL